MTDRRYIQTLSGLAQEYKNKSFISRILFPVVTVKERVVEIPIRTKDDFKIYNTLRAKYGDSNIAMSDGGDTILLKLKERDLSFPIDLVQTPTAQIKEKRKRNTIKAQKGIELGLEKEAADLAQDASQYPTGHKVALTGTSQFTDSASVPLKVIRDGKKAIRKQIGEYPNTIIMGSTVLEALQEHPDFIIADAQGKKSYPSEKDVETRLGFEYFAVGKSVHLDEQTKELVDLWKNHVILAYTNPEAKVDGDEGELYFSYTLRLEDFPKTDQHTISDGKVIGIRNTDYVVPTLMESKCGYLIQNAVPE